MRYTHRHCEEFGQVSMPQLGPKVTPSKFLTLVKNVQLPPFEPLKFKPFSTIFDSAVEMRDNIYESQKFCLDT